MSDRRSAALAWGLAGISLIVLVARAASVLVDERLGVEPLQTLIGVEFLAVGGLLAARRPANRIGWVFLAGGACTALMHLLGAYSIFGFEIASSRPPAVAAASLLYSFLWLPMLALVPTYGILYFPDGRLPGPRWRAVWWLVTAGFVILIAWYLVASWRHTPGFELEFPGENPLHTHALDPILPMMFNVGAILLLGGTLGCVASLVVRYLRSRGDEREQLKWVAYAIVLGATLWFSGDLYNELIPWQVIYAVVLSLFPLSIVVAVLKYRLYDIDVVISKTVVFAGLAGFITTVYVAIVVGVGSLLGAGDEPNLGLSIVATAVVAVAFQPVRERLTRLANWLVYGRRATPYEVLSRFSSQVGETVATEQTLGHMARLLAEGTGAARAQVWLKVGEQMRSAASWPEEAAPNFAPLVNVDGSLPEFAEVDLAVPVSHDGQLLGALTLTKKRGEPVNSVERGLVEDLAAQAGLVLRNVGLTADLRARLEELRDSRRRLVGAQDQERRRLERDLHDGAQQQLVALKIKLNLAKNLAERNGSTQAAALIEQLSEETDEAVAALRELAHGIYPPLLAAEGLEGALRARAAKAPIPVIIEAEGMGRFSQEVEAAVYFCVLEAIQNAVKYANASQVTVRLAKSDGQLTFEVADDGVGFDPATTPRGHGLTNMADRVHALDGTLQIQSTSVGGTRVLGRLPLLREALVS